VPLYRSRCEVDEVVNGLWMDRAVIAQGGAEGSYTAAVVEQ
jgi:hypothetical protein